MSSCTFIGHRDCPQEMKVALYHTIKDFILNYDVKRFYIGTQGNFDRYVYDVLVELEREYEIEIIVVLAYLDKNDKAYYDINKTEFPCELDRVPLRFAIKTRNEYMITRSQYMVCYVNNTFSNSYKFVEIAKRHNLKILNLGELPI